MLLALSVMIKQSHGESVEISYADSKKYLELAVKCNTIEQAKEIHAQLEIIGGIVDMTDEYGYARFIVCCRPTSLYNKLSTQGLVKDDSNVKNNNNGHNHVVDEDKSKEEVKIVTVIVNNKTRHYIVIVVIMMLVLP